MWLIKINKLTSCSNIIWTNFSPTKFLASILAYIYVKEILHHIIDIYVKMLWQEFDPVYMNVQFYISLRLIANAWP